MGITATGCCIFLIPSTAESGEDECFAFAHTVERDQVIVIYCEIVVAVQLHQFPNTAFENGKAGISRGYIPKGLFWNFDYMLIDLN